MRTLGLVLAAMVVSSPAVDAQMAGGKIVRVEDRRPIAGVTVVVRNVVSDAAVQTVSDSGGMFTLFPDGAGRYVIVFRRGSDIASYPDTVTLTADSLFQRLFVLAFASPRDSSAVVMPDSPVVPLGAFEARYPPELAERRIEGSVDAQFVVDTTGRADMRTFRVLRVADNAFIQSVRESVASARFRPASIRGHKVRQMVTRTFHFCLSAASSAIGMSDRRPVPILSSAGCR